MDVQCERCQAEYQLEAARIPPGGASVRCTACGHVFRVSRPGEDAGEAAAAGARSSRDWRLRRVDGAVIPFKDSSVLQQWILEGQATREDELSPDGVAWRRLGEVPQLLPVFERVDAFGTVRTAEEPETPMEQTGRQFPAAAPEVSPPPTDVEATRVYDTSKLPTFETPVPEGEHLPPWEPVPEKGGVEEQFPGAVTQPLPSEVHVPAGELAGEAPAPVEEELPPARPVRPRWLVPAAAAAALAGVAAVALFTLRTEEPPPTRPRATRPGAPAGARTPVGVAAVDAGAPRERVAAAPATTARDAGIAAPGQKPAVVEAPGKGAGVSPAPRAAGAAVAADAGVPADAVAAAEDGEMFDRWLLFGDRRLKEGDSRKALRSYTRAAELDPSSPEPYVRRGQAQLSLGNPKAAVVDYREALERDPRNGPAIFGLAEASQALGETKDAREGYQRYLKVLPRGPRAEEARAKLGELESKQ